MSVVFFLSLAFGLAVNGVINGFTSTGIIQIVLAFILAVIFVLKRYHKLFFGKGATLDVVILFSFIALSVLISYLFGLSRPESIQVRSIMDSRKASELIKKGEYKKAIDILEKQAKESVITLNGRMNLGSAYLNIGKSDLARVQYDIVLKAFPPNAVCYFNYGLLFLNENDLGNAKNCFVISTRYNPQLWMSYLYAGSVSRLQGNVKQALDMYIKADRRSPGQPYLRYLMAKSTYELNDMDVARARIEKALEMDQMPKARSELESMLKEVNRFKRGDQQ